MDPKDITFEGLQLSQLDEVTQMVIDAFETNNVFSKEGLETKEQLDFRVRVSVNLFYNAQQKFNETHSRNVEFLKVLKHKGKIVAVVMAIQLKTFYTDLLTMIDPEDPYIQIFKHLNPDDYPPNTALLGSMLAVRKDYMKGKLSKMILELGVRQAVIDGFQYIFGTATNPISLKLSLQFGAEILKDSIITRYGKQGKMTLVRINLPKLVQALNSKPKL